MEGELGRYRRKWLVPVPQADDLDELNRQLLADCTASRSRTIFGRNMTIAEVALEKNPSPSSGISELVDRQSVQPSLFLQSQFPDTVGVKSKVVHDIRRASAPGLWRKRLPAPTS